MDAADLAPVPESQRTQPAFDLFLIFAAANVVATTLQTGAVLGARYRSSDVLMLVVGGACFGALLVALLAPVGSRTGVPSMIAARAPLGWRGAQLVSGLLYLTNFAWIAVNNTIAASVCAQVIGGPSTSRLWAAGLGLLATAVVARGPRAVGQADRLAVPIMVIAGTILTYAAFTTPIPETAITSPPETRPAPSAQPLTPDAPSAPQAPTPAPYAPSAPLAPTPAPYAPPAPEAPPPAPYAPQAPEAPAPSAPPPAPYAPAPLAPYFFGIDVVIGYQVSWLLMFADYSRYTRSARAAATSVFAGLALPALWLMPVGWNLARIAGSDDPGTMLAAANTGWWTAVLVALATVTTNFVNIYLSSLAWRTLAHRSSGTGTVWTIGIIGTVLGLVSSVWLTRFAEMMVWLGAILVPVGGVFLAHFVIARRPVDVEAIYRADRVPAFTVAGIAAWAAGFAVYKLAAPIGATLPALGTSIVVYLVLLRTRPFASTTPSG